MVKVLSSIVIALSFATITRAESQPPAPTPAEESKAPKSKPAKDQKRAATDQRGTDASPLVEKIAPSHETQPPAEGKPYKHYHETPTDWWLIGPNIFLTIFTGLLFAYTAYLARISRRSVGIVQDTAIRQLRAYVHINSDETISVNGGAVRVEFTMKNFGQTPAYDFMSRVNIGWFKLPLDEPLDPPIYPAGSSKSHISPTGIIRQRIELPERLTDEKIKATNSGAYGIYVWGECKYFDAFKKERKTRFRLSSCGEDFVYCRLAYCEKWRCNSEQGYKWKLWV